MPTRQEFPDGTTYEVGEPEVVGIIPVRMELLVFPADTDPEPIKWRIYEYSGSEVYRLVDGEMVEEPIQTRDGLKVGDTVACPSLGGYFRATIEIGTDGALYAKSPNDHVGFLEFNTDDRHCWTCCGTANMRGIMRLEITR